MEIQERIWWHPRTDAGNYQRFILKTPKQGVFEVTHLICPIHPNLKRVTIDGNNGNGQSLQIDGSTPGNKTTSMNGEVLLLYPVNFTRVLHPYETLLTLTVECEEIIPAFYFGAKGFAVEVSDK